jgi:predicted phage terminase large subunit-like protein
MDDELIEILKDKDVRQKYTMLPAHRQAAFDWRTSWLCKAHDHQILPPGDWWTIWLLLAGRGAGKTRTAAEQIGYWAWQYPGSRWLVAAPTSADVRSTCFEGDSGLIAVIPPILVEDYNRAYHEIKLVNGSLIKGVPASEPERFRGGQYHGAWCCSPGTMIAMADGTEVAIEALKAGDMVATRHGPRKVMAAGISGNPNDTVSIDCGVTRLTVTVDHPILVGDQWIPAGDLNEGDLVWGISGLTVDTHTASFTSSTLAPSLLDGLSITKTETSATTILPILRRCQEATTSGITRLGGLLQKLRPEPLLQRLNCFVCQSLQSAFNAVQSLFPVLQMSRGNFALGHALNAGGQTLLSQSRGTALFAEANTSQRSGSSGIAASDAITDLPFAPIDLKQLEVRRVERLPNSVTYNLTVEGEHEFIANGIVVHNCDELAAWEYLQEAWDQIQFSVRLGQRTRILATTTPKPKDLIVDLVGREGKDVFLSSASTYSNLDNLAPSFRAQILQYEGTKLGRQEIYAEIIDPEESGIVKRDWFRLWPAQKPLPKLEFVIQSYDCAYTDKTINDPTACLTFGVFKPLDGGMCALLIDAWQDRLQYPDLRPKVIEEYETVYGEEKDGKRVDLILVEDKSAGISLIQDLQRAHVPVRAYNPGRADKVQRLSIVANIIRAGRIWIPESSARAGFVRDWAEGFVSQICSFPDTSHDDFVDACTQALRYLRDAGWLVIDAPSRDWLDDEDYADAGRKKRENPYAL